MAGKEKKFIPSKKTGGSLYIPVNSGQASAND
jgi:hypothetical protein